MGSSPSKGTTNANGSLVAAGTSMEVVTKEPIKIDDRLPYANFRELFTVKNYWKTISRRMEICSKIFLFKFLKENPEMQSRYPKLASLHIESPECSEKAFETIASEYLKVFDEVIESVEKNPGDASAACERLKDVGKMHRRVTGMKQNDFNLMEGPFLYMISEILQDRYNEKAERLFKKFFDFCIKFILEGFGS